MKLSEITNLIGGELIGDDDYEINGVGKIENAFPFEITFISNPAYEKYYQTTKAGAVIVSKTFYRQIKDSNKHNVLVVDDPYISFLKLLEILAPKKELQDPGIHPSAVISETALTGKNTSIGSHCYIGDNCVIGDNTKILPNTVIMNNSRIGSEVIIYPNVTIYNETVIGNNVIIHSGTAIGSDGFGQAKMKTGEFKKIPQVGNVIIEDNVEIGSNCSIDRATIGSTKICRGVKLDNQIQVAHNVIIGENTVIAAQTGIAGSSTIGKNCMIGGKVGIVGHIDICDNVIITAAVGVSKSITEPGMYSGYRAQPIKKELKKEALLRNLENIIKELKNKK